MSPEESTIIEEARRFLDELVTQGLPLRTLLNHGTFPDGWPSRYLAFVERVAKHYGETEPLPRDVLAVIYYASVYCTKRYQDWQRWASATNDATADAVIRVRWAGDQLVLERYWRDGEPAV
jgi:hypothetical protein